MAHLDFGPIWNTLRNAFEETGLGETSDRYLASFQKPEYLGDRLNSNNWTILEANQA